jgi:hypothetical protein
MDNPDRELTASQLDGVCGGTGETSGMDIEALAFFLSWVLRKATKKT